MINKKINPTSLRIPTKAYSQGVLVPKENSNLLFITGQLPQNLDGEIIFTENVEAQVRLVFDRILKILNEADMTFNDVVKLQIFVKDVKDSKIVSSVRDELFSDSRPASTLVAISGFAKEGCSVEIDAISAK